VPDLAKTFLPPEYEASLSGVYALRWLAQLQQVYYQATAVFLVDGIIDHYSLTAVTSPFIFGFLFVDDDPW
jgi:hypothetical protein